MIDRLDVPSRAGHEFPVRAVAVHDVAAHRQVRCVDLQAKAGGDDRLVLGLHRLADRLEILVERVVILVGLEQRDDPGGRCVHERIRHRLIGDRRAQMGEISLKRPTVFVGDRAATDRTQVPGTAAPLRKPVAKVRIGVQIRWRCPGHIADLEPAEAVADVGGVADLAHLPVAHNVDSGVDLVTHAIAHRRGDQLVVAAAIHGLAAVFGEYDVDDLLRPRQAANVGGQDPCARCHQRRPNEDDPLTASHDPLLGAPP